MQIKVKRETLGPEATHGIMEVDGDYFGVTLELPWKDNAHAVSCIPAGTYPLGVTYSPRFGRNLLLVRDVPRRAGIRIHNANYASELRGCIAVAKQRIADGHIQGGMVPELKEMADQAMKRGEALTIEIVNP